MLHSSLYHKYNKAPSTVCYCCTSRTLWQAIINGSKYLKWTEQVFELLHKPIYIQWALRHFISIGKTNTGLDGGVNTEFHIYNIYIYIYIYIYIIYVCVCVCVCACARVCVIVQLCIYKGKAIPLEAWVGPDGSRRMKAPDFKTVGTWRW